ncbi:unnamed protein product [Prunus armeniaca]
MRQEFPKGGIRVPIRFLRGNMIVIQLSISSVIREARGNDQEHPKCSPENAEYARSPSRGTLAFAKILREMYNQYNSQLLKQLRRQYAN